MPYQAMKNEHGDWVVVVPDGHDCWVVAKAIPNYKSNEETAVRIAKALNLLDDMEHPGQIQVFTSNDPRRQERLHLAGMAMAVVAQWPSNKSGEMTDGEVAQFAVRIADALLERLAKDN